MAIAILTPLSSWAIGQRAQILITPDLRLKAAERRRRVQWTLVHGPRLLPDLIYVIEYFDCLLCLKLNLQPFFRKSVG